MKKIFVCLLALLCLTGIALGETSVLPEPDEPSDTPVQRVVYLTFDDGPRKDTPELLALLEELDVPATFFYVGASIKQMPELAKMVYEKGYPIGCHTMYHETGRIRKDPAQMIRDGERFTQMMREYVDEGYEPRLYRFPGGSTTYTKTLRRIMAQNGWFWVDWNAMTGDAQYSFRNAHDMYTYTLKTIGEKDVVVLLMHENKRLTKAILPELVAYFRENGYEFRALTGSEEDAETLAGSTVNFMTPEGEAE